MISKTNIRPREKINPERWQQLKDILADALEVSSAAERTALLETRCAQDAALRAEAEALVREAEAIAQGAADSFEDCAEHATRALWQEETTRRGWRIGAYAGGAGAGTRRDGRGVSGGTRGWAV